MDVLQTMRFFAAVAQSGSFTAAAQLLDTTTTNVSKAVSSLEARLHTRLINRTTRRLALTEAGIRYLQRCEKILEEIREAEEEAGFLKTTSPTCWQPMKKSPANQNIGLASDAAMECRPSIVCTALNRSSIQRPSLDTAARGVDRWSPRRSFAPVPGHSHSGYRSRQ